MSGFGEDINWVSWEDAIETALEKDKPIFLLIHKSWCHACKGLFFFLLCLNCSMKIFQEEISS